MILVLGVLSAIGSLMLASDDFAAIERDRASAAFVAEIESDRLQTDWVSMADFAEFEAWMASEPHAGLTRLEWCVVLPDPADASSRMSALLRYVVPGGSQRKLLRGSSVDGRATRWVRGPGLASWPVGWEASVDPAREC